MWITDDTPQRARSEQPKLDDLERELGRARPGTLDLDFWNRILEAVEALPRQEEVAWKVRNMARLRNATGRRRGIMAVTPRPRPWGLSRMAPYASRPSIWPTRMEVDPVSQVGRYFDLDGEVMPIFEASARGAHGTLDQTNVAKTTGGTRDGAEDTDYDTDQKSD